MNTINEEIPVINARVGTLETENVARNEDINDITTKFPPFDTKINDLETTNTEITKHKYGALH